MSLRNERYLKRGREERFEDGATLFVLGDPCSDGDVFFLLEGAVEVDCPGAQGSEAGRLRVEAGEVFGMEEPYGGTRRRTRAATAVGSVLVYRWTRKCFDEAVGIYQELATQAIRTLSQRLRELNRARVRGGRTA